MRRSVLLMFGLSLIVIVRVHCQENFGPMVNKVNGLSDEMAQVKTDLLRVEKKITIQIDFAKLSLRAELNQDMEQIVKNAIAEALQGESIHEIVRNQVVSEVRQLKRQLHEVQNSLRDIQKERDGYKEMKIVQAPVNASVEDVSSTKAELTLLKALLKAVEKDILSIKSELEIVKASVNATGEDGSTKAKLTLFQASLKAAERSILSTKSEIEAVSTSLSVVRQDNRAATSRFNDMQKLILKLEKVMNNAAPLEPPFNVSARSPKSSEIHIDWNIPRNGELKGFELSYGARGIPRRRVRLTDPTKHNMTLYGLKPFIKYQLQLLAFNDAGSGPPAKLYVRTAEGVPSKPRITHISNRMAQSYFVHWRQPRVLNGRLKKYELQWSSNSSSATRIITGDLTNPMSAFIRDLEPYTEYKIRVAAYSGGGKGEFSDEFPGVTDVKSPSAPTITNFTVVGPQSIYLQWDPPDIYYKTINNYILKCYTGDASYYEDKLVDGSVTEITWSGLPENRDYRLKLAGQTNAIFSKTTYVGEFTAQIEFTLGGHHAFGSHITTPSEPPPNVNAHSPKSSEIHIDWNIPRNKLNGELKGYELSYWVRGMPRKTVRLRDPTKHNVILYGLKPFTKYQLQLLAFNDAGSGPPANLSVRTAEGVPSKPRITHISSRMSQSYFVHWKRPKARNGRLKKYELQLSYNSSSATRITIGHLTNPMSAFIRELEPYTEYKIRVAAYTGGGKGEFSDEFPGMTEVAGPSAPTITNFTVVGPQSIYLQWDPPDIYYKTINNYILKCYTGDASYYEDKLVDGLVTEITLSGLPENQTYRLKLAGITDAIFSETKYFGEFTEPIEFTLRGSRNVPSKPRITHISNRTAQSYYVHWEQPKVRNGRLEKYELQWSSNSSSATRIITGELTNPMSAFIRELEPYTEYKIRVAAYTGGGKGEFSDEFPGMTEVKGPSVPTITNFTVVGPQSIYLQWGPPDIYYKTINNYILKCYTRDYTYHEDKLVDGSVTEITLSGLPENLDYRLKLAGVTHAIFSKTKYFGEFTEPIEFTLRGSRNVPSKPRITHISNQNPRSYYVHWERPKVLHGRLEKYELQWSDNSSSASRIIAGDLTNPMSAFIGGLEPYTEYKIRVAAYTGGEKGEFSDEFTGMTEVKGPSAPTITNFAVVGPQSIYLQWNPPDIYYKTINNYILKCYTGDYTYYEDKFVDGSVTEITLSGLPENLDYRLKLAGVTHAIFSKTKYFGEFTEPIEFTLRAL